MSSPAGSPPAPAHAALPNSRKRPSTGGSQANAKRRKASTYSVASSNHPLRQTSFPPEENGTSSGLRSPSVDTDIVAPSTTTSLTGGKRGKKGKSVAPEGSVRSGKAGHQPPRGDTESKADGDDGEEDDDDEDDEAGLDESNRQQAEEQAADMKRRYAMLFEAADDEQQDRLGEMRRFRLSDQKVRRIVNQTLSQSVPKSVILAINSYTKQFVGELVERALDVQRLNQMAAKTYPSPETEQDKGSDGAEKTNVNGEEKTENIGPLLPDSLREAFRRMKRDGELGGAGMEGFSTGLGVPGAKAAALGGRRLFR